MDYSTLHDTWTLLTQLLQLGHQRVPISENLSQQLSTLGIPENLEDQERIRKGLAKVYLLMTANGHVVQLPQNLQTSPPEDDRKIIPVEIADYFWAPSYEKLLPILVEQSIQSNARFSDTMTSKMMDKISEAIDWLPIFYPMIQAREQWLIQQNPIWKTLIPPAPDVNYWNKSTDIQKPILAQVWHPIQSKWMEELLVKAWIQLETSVQISCIQALDTTSNEIQTWLEARMEHSGPNVQRHLAIACGKYDQKHPFLQPYYEAMDSLLAPKSLEKLQLPEPKNPMWENLGLSSEGLSGMGKKAAILQLLAAGIPVTYWSARLQATPTQVIESIGKSDWAGIILTALMESLLVWPEVNYQKAILRYWANHPHLPIWRKPLMELWLKQLSKSVFDEIALEWAAAQEHVYPEQSPLIRLLSLNVHPWSDVLAHHTWDLCRSYINEGNQGQKDLLVQQLLQWTAMHATIHHRPAFAKLWNPYSKHWSRWEKIVRQSLQILQTRGQWEAWLKEGSHETQEPVRSKE